MAVAVAGFVEIQAVGTLAAVGAGAERFADLVVPCVGLHGRSPLLNAGYNSGGVDFSPRPCRAWPSRCLGKDQTLAAGLLLEPPSLGCGGVVSARIAGADADRAEVGVCQGGDGFLAEHRGGISFCK